MIKIRFEEKKLTVDVTEATVDDFLELAIHTFHIDDLKKLNEAMNEFITNNPQLPIEETE